jgi:magnesium transporter
VITVRSSSKQSFENVRDRCEREPKLLSLGSGYVLYALMDEVVDRYVPILDQLQAELESIEEHIFVPGAARSNLQRLYALKRKALVLEHAVGSMLQFTGKFQRRARAHRVPGPAALLPATPPITWRAIEAALDTIRETIATGDHGEPLARHDRGRRGDEAARRLGRDLRRGHRLRRHLGR